jgi:hypothetical protein
MMFVVDPLPQAEVVSNRAQASRIISRPLKFLPDLRSVSGNKPKRSASVAGAKKALSMEAFAADAAGPTV